MALADRGEPVRRHIVRSGLPLRLRPVGPARRILGGWISGVFPDFLSAPGDDSLGTRYIDDLAALGGGVLSVEAKAAGCRTRRRARLCAEHQGSAGLARVPDLRACCVAPHARRVLDPQPSAAGVAGLATRIFGVYRKRLA